MRKYEEALGGVDSKAKKVNFNISKGLKDTVAPIFDLIRAFRRVGFVVSATFGSIIGTVLAGANEMVKMRDTANQLGITVEEVAKRFYGFKGSMVDAQAGSMMMRKHLDDLKNQFYGLGLALGDKYLDMQSNVMSFMSRFSEKGQVDASKFKEFLLKQSWATTEEKIKAETSLTDNINRLSQSSTEFQINQLRKLVTSWENAGADITKSEEYYTNQRNNLLTKQMIKNNEFYSRIKAFQGDKLGVLKLKQGSERMNFDMENPGKDSRTMTQRMQLAEQQALEMKQLEQEVTDEISKQEAKRLAVQGYTIDALIKEQEVLANEYKKSWAIDSPQMKAFMESQAVILGTAKETALGITKMWQDVGTGMEDSFSSMFKDSFRGELKDFRDYFENFCYSITDAFSDMVGKMISNMLLFGNTMGQGDNPLGGFGGLVSKGIMAMFGGGASAGGDVGSFADMTDVFAYHKGGAVRKAHSGLAMDEVPIIAQTGEGILSRRGMSSLGRGNFERLNSGQGVGVGGGVTITIAPVIQAWDTNDVYRNRKQITEAVAQDILNNGTVRKVIQQVR
jgi:hypothetical protein